MKTEILSPYRVKIAVPDIKRFLTETISIYYQLFSNHVQTLINYEKKLGQCDGLRKQAIEQILHASEHNTLLIKDIVDALLPTIEVDQLLQYKYRSRSHRGSNNLNGYLPDLKYMSRDWSNTTDGERQVKQIIDTMLPAIKQYADNKEQALFLGAGMGRLAWEHSSFFEKVIALDKSFSMGFNFQRLCQEDISFYDINTINILEANDVTQKLTASLKNADEKTRGNKERVEYIVADATHFPFEVNSLDCIASVYFTDLMALQLYFKEILRTLRPGGLFVHFGPLDYFFSEITATLSAEEIRIVFEENGFTSMHHEVIETKHLGSSNSLLSKSYRNWFYIAKRKA